MVKHDLLARGIASVVGAIVNGLQTTVNNLAITVANHATYSTTEEVVIGTYDGKPLYRKAVIIPALASVSGATNYAHGVLNIGKIMLGKNSHAVNSNSNSYIPIPCVTTNAIDQIGVSFNNTNVIVIVGKNQSVFNATIFLEYTKTTD